MCVGLEISVASFDGKLMFSPVGLRFSIRDRSSSNDGLHKVLANRAAGHVCIWSDWQELNFNVWGFRWEQKLDFIKDILRFLVPGPVGLRFVARWA